MDATCRAPIELRFKFAVDNHLFAHFSDQYKCWVCEKSWAIDLYSATFTENWIPKDFQCLQWGCRKEVWPQLQLGAKINFQILKM